MIPARPVGRRAVLRLSAGGAALLAIGGGLFSWMNAGYASQLAREDTPIALSVKELAVVRALVEALFPEGDGFPSGVALGIHQQVDQELWAGSDYNRGALKDGLQVLEHVPPLFGRAHRFTALALEVRVEVFDAMLRSGRATLRQIAVALKQLTHLLYYGNERVWPSIHYDGTFIETPRPPASAVAYAELLKARRGA